MKVCVGQFDDPQRCIVDRAVELGAQKVQFVSWVPFTKADVDKAHLHGIICNACQADTEAKAREFLEMGIDTVMTNDYGRISQIVKEYRK